MSPLHPFSPRTARLLWAVFVAMLAASVLAELLVRRHGLFGIDETFAFNAWYGFGACVVLILGAKLIGYALKRRDTYYDR